MNFLFQVSSWEKCRNVPDRIWEKCPWIGSSLACLGWGATDGATGGIYMTDIMGHGKKEKRKKNNEEENSRTLN